MRKSAVSEKCVRVKKDMYDDTVTAGTCAVRMNKRFKEELELHQVSVWRLFLFANVMH